jgi:hypothetical protein
LGALIKALLFGKALSGLLTDAELLAASAVLGRGRGEGHPHDCCCDDCDDRAILGLEDDDDR